MTTDVDVQVRHDDEPIGGWLVVPLPTTSHLWRWGRIHEVIHQRGRTYYRVRWLGDVHDSVVLPPPEAPCRERAALAEPRRRRDRGLADVGRLAGVPPVASGGASCCRAPATLSDLSAMAWERASPAPLRRGAASPAQAIRGRCAGRPGAAGCRR